MNIFYLDTDLAKCAQYHNDKHCVKMILEYAQLLCTAHRILDGDLVLKTDQKGRKVKAYALPDSEKDNIFYKHTHVNHPCAVWARDSSQNYHLLYKLFIELCNEYTHRYGKTHLTYSKLSHLLKYPPNNISDSGLTSPPKCMPDFYKKGNVIESYRTYYVSDDKKHLLSYSKRPKPFWIK